ncbi:MAG: hypothetical protein JJE22_16990 [Bacteroidia bacterium]|nr:hypothetical protein [Bacteroidia bacterium]
MKKAILVALLAGGFIFQSTNAQVHVDVKFNIGSQPGWGPVGYDYVDYYYLPDIDAFYYVPRQQYIYMYRGHWRFTRSLPYQFRDYNFNTGYKVVVNEPRPYYHADMYRTKYASYKGHHDDNQEIIRNSHESRYYESRGHPQHSEWRNNGNQGNNGKHGRGRNGHN